MEHRGLAELLAEYGNQLDQKTPGVADTGYAELSPEQQQELLSLLQLAGQVKDALAPAHPAPAFRRKLRSDLTEMARRRMSQDVIVELHSAPRELLIGAAIGSAVALAGGIAYLIRARTQARS